MYSTGSSTPSSSRQASAQACAYISSLLAVANRWLAAVDIVGPTKLVAVVETRPPTWRPADERDIGHPEHDFDFLMSRSSVTYVDQIRTPLFVIQGANDQRAPRSE